MDKRKHNLFITVVVAVFVALGSGYVTGYLLYILKLVGYVERIVVLTGSCLSTKTSPVIIDFQIFVSYNYRQCLFLIQLG